MMPIKSVLIALFVVLSLSIFSVAQAEDNGVQTINFEHIPFKNSPADVKDNALFWDLIPDKPIGIKMAETLQYARVDLDGDGVLDLLGTLSGNGTYCGHQHAECALFSVVKGRLVESDCNAPMYADIEILASKTHGLRDIRWNGGCLLRYDGQGRYGSDERAVP
jgi:uncharacterized protein YuzB (UPF0349 family)